MMNRHAQIWIETVLYTLIGIALIGLVLSYVFPKIQDTQERLLIEQTIESLHALDEVIAVVLERGPGNVKSYGFEMGRGTLFIDAERYEIKVVIAGLSTEYSEPGVEIDDGRILLLTTKEQQGMSISMKLIYGNIGINLTMQGSDESRTFTQAATPYTFFVENRETVDGNGLRKTSIDIVEAANRIAG